MLATSVMSEGSAESQEDASTLVPFEIGIYFLDDDLRRPRWDVLRTEELYRPHGPLNEEHFTVVPAISLTNEVTGTILRFRIRGGDKFCFAGSDSGQAIPKYEPEIVIDSPLSFNEDLTADGKEFSVTLREPLNSPAGIPVRFSYRVFVTDGRNQQAIHLPVLFYDSGQQELIRQLSSNATAESGEEPDFGSLITLPIEIGQDQHDRPTYSIFRSNANHGLPVSAHLAPAIVVKEIDQSLTLDFTGMTFHTKKNPGSGCDDGIFGLKPIELHWCGVSHPKPSCTLSEFQRPAVGLVGSGVLPGSTRCVVQWNEPAPEEEDREASFFFAARSSSSRAPILGDPTIIHDHPEDPGIDQTS